MGMYGEIGAQGMTQMGANWSMGLSLIGRAIAQGQYDQANRLYQEILSSISAEEVPKFQQMMAQEIPEADKIIGGGEGRSAQQNALIKLQSFVDQGGLDAQARAQNEEALSGADQRAQGNRGALMQQYARRGMQGSGSELGSMLQANQSSANQGRQASLDIAGSARSRALSALGQQASIGGQMRGQDIDVESKNAAAQRERDLFNAKMRYAAMGANNDMNQQDFMNRMSKQRAMAAAKGKVADQWEKGARQTQSDWSGAGQAMNYKHQSLAEGSEEMPF